MVSTILLAVTILVLTAAAAALAVAMWTKRAWLRTFVLGAASVWFAFYGVTLLATSFFSAEKTLRPGEAKKFCGFYFDCHLSASVVGVRRAKTFGALRAKDEFYIVRLRIANDARAAALALETPRFALFDEQGRRYEPVEDLTVTRERPRFEEPVPAGGAIAEELAFDLPPDAWGLRLDAREGGPLARAFEKLLIGDEDSFLHRRVFFALAEQTAAAGVQ